MIPVPGRESLQRRLIQGEGRSAAQLAQAPQMTPTIEAAIANHKPNRPLSSLQGRAASLPGAALPVQPHLAHQVFSPTQQVSAFMYPEIDQQVSGLIIPDKYKNVHDIVLAIVTKKGHALQQASERLKDDETIVLAAVSQNGFVLQDASARLKDNQAIVLAAVTQFAYALEHASERLKDNQAIVLAAVTRRGGVLRHASERLKDNQAIVLAAVTENGLALEHASARLKDNQAIVLAAVTQHSSALRYSSALQYASERLKDNQAIVLAAVTQNSDALLSASERLKDDPAIVFAAVTQQPDAIWAASARLKADHAFLLAAVTQNGLVLESISAGFKTVEIACAAVAQNRKAMRFVPEDLIKRADGEIDKNPAFLPIVNPSHIEYQHGLQAVKLNPLLLRFVPPKILEQRPVDGTEDNDIILLALKQNPEALHLIPWELLTGPMLSFVIEMHKRDNKRNLILSLVKLARIMGSKPLAEIRNPHLDLAWPLLEFFENSKYVMLVLINRYGLGIADVGNVLKNDPDIIALDAQTLKQSLHRAFPHSFVENSLDGPLLSTLEPYLTNG